jgi:GNAT superfamily N-acetyltransferase
VEKDERSNSGSKEPEEHPSPSSVGTSGSHQMPDYNIDLIENVDDVHPLFMNFIKASPYKNYPVSEDMIRTVLEQGICFTLKVGSTDPWEESKVVGFLLAAESKFHPYLGVCSIASELAWWVEPEHRGHGKKLLEAFLDWAEAAEFQYITMSALGDELDQLYQSYGFDRNEVVYIKRV